MKKIAQVIGSKRLTADVFTVAETVKNLNRRFFFDVIIPKDAEYRDILLGLGARVITLDATHEVNAKTILCFKRYFCENPADIVHTHVSAGARIGARLAGIKNCISSRGFNSGEPRPAKWITSPIYNIFTTATLCTSESSYDLLVREGVRRDRILPLLPYGAFGGGKWAREKREEKEILIVCPLPFYKGFGQKTLVRAFSKMQSKRPSRLVFVGEGPEKEECRLLAGRLGVGGRVDFRDDVMLTKVYNMKPTLTVFTQEEGWELPCALLGGARTSTVASDLPENKDLFSDTCEFYLRGDEFSLERAMLRSLSDGYAPDRTTEVDFETPLGVICESHERIYEALLSL